MLERELRIELYRQDQPIEELRRKQAKAYTRKYWTQEDIDLAERQASEWSAFFKKNSR